MAAAAYVAEVLGARYAEPPAADLGEALAEEPPTNPLLLLQAHGDDSSEAIGRLAAEHGAAQGLSALALGQGQVLCVLAV